VRWSPDGRWLLVSGTETNADGYRLNLRLIPANGGNITVLDGKMGPSGANFVFISSLYWIP
jgi:Tol biopolymer transport system component